MSHLIKKKYENEISNFIYYKNFFDKDYYDKILIWLNNQNFIGERNIDRQQIWFDDNENYFCNHWKKRHKRWEPHKYCNFLKEIQQKIINKINVDIDTCLINKYNTGNDIISKHKDNATSFGERPTIIIYSLGTTRRFMLTSDVDNSTIIYKLKPNSLFIMDGGSQLYFTHELLKDNTKDIRYSLTFRKFIN